MKERPPHKLILGCRAKTPAGIFASPERMVLENLNSVFVASSNPRAVQVSPPHPNLRGPGWTACVRAELTNAVGKPLGTETYRISIESGVIIDRQRVPTDDNCVSETFEPIQ